MGKLNFSPAYQQVFVRGPYVNRVPCQTLTILRFLYCFACFACKQGSQMAFVGGIEVLHHYDRRKLGA